MDFAFTPEQDRYRQQLRQWLQENLPEGWTGAHCEPKSIADSAHLRLEWERKLFRAGYNGVHWPVAYGGRGLSYLHYLIVCEELGRVAAPEPWNVAGRELAGPLLLAVGSEAQKAHFLPRIIAIEDVWCQAFTEPDAGSDLWALRTTATREGANWIINGHKIWTSFANFANWCCLLARTDPAAVRHRGISIFLVPMSAPGIVVRPIEQINGRAEINEIFFENVRVPLDSTLGAVNEGGSITNEVLAVERGTSRLYRQATFQNEFEHLVRLALGKPHRGARLADDSHFRQRLARVYSLLRIHRYHNLKCIARLDAGEKIGAEASFVKVLWSELHQQLAQLSLDVLGSEGLLQDAQSLGEGRFQDAYFTSRAGTIYAGTAQMQRNTIAERLLDLPR